MQKVEPLSFRLKTLRAERDVGQSEVAEAVGVSRSFVAGMETGKDIPGRETVLALATYYDVSLHWLLTGEGDRKPPPTAAADLTNEDLLLQAFRLLPNDEKKAYLNLLLTRVEPMRDDGPGKR